MATHIDLSHPIANGTVTYPGLPGPVITDFLSREESRDQYEKGTEFQIGRIEMVSNTGTYLDAPSTASRTATTWPGWLWNGRRISKRSVLASRKAVRSRRRNSETPR